MRGCDALGARNGRSMCSGAAVVCGTGPVTPWLAMGLWIVGCGCAGRQDPRVPCEHCNGAAVGCGIGLVAPPLAVGVWLWVVSCGLGTGA